MSNKFLLFASLAGISALGLNNVQAQTGYTIHGDIQGWKDPYIYMAFPMSGNPSVDSAVVTNGKFTFTGKLDEPAPAEIYNRDKNTGVSLFVENSNITVTGNIDSLKNAKITGSSVQQDADELRKSTASIGEQEQALYAKYQEAATNKDTVAEKQYAAQFDSLDNLSKNLSIGFAKSHPKSFLSLTILEQIAYGMNFSDVSSIFNAFDPSVKNTPKGKKFAERVAALENIQDGKPAIAFTQNDTTGKPVNLSDFKGKYVLVDFWASWCGPCRAENPNVVKAYNKYKDKNFTILGVSLDQNAEKWKEAILKDNLTWTEVSDLKFWKNEAAAKYGVQAIPANFLIDPNGIIIGHDLRGDDLENKLAEVLK